MRRVVIDASAMGAIVFGEPEGVRIAARIDGASLFAPRLLQFELISIGWKKARRHPSLASVYMAGLGAALTDRWEIGWRHVQAVDVALVALATGLSPYDSAYIWLAGTLGADLVTLDSALARFADVV